jgi:peptidase E
MGGGGFTMEPENPALDDYVLSLADVPMPRICLLPTASGDGETQIRQFHATFGARACEPLHISLFRLGSRPVPLRETLLAQDIIYVGGGSMLGLLAVWRALGLDVILREAWENGVVLAGLSAGAMCWFEWGVTKSLGHPAPSPGLGFLPGSMSVHMDGEPARLPVCRAAIADGTLPPGYAADDGVALLFRGTELEEVVSSRPSRRALQLGPGGETELEPRLLARPDRYGPTPEIAEYRRVRALRPASRSAWSGGS